MDGHGHPASPTQRIMDGQPRTRCVTCHSPTPYNAVSREGQCPICYEDFPTEDAALTIRFLTEPDDRSH